MQPFLDSLLALQEAELAVLNLQRQLASIPQETEVRKGKLDAERREKDAIVKGARDAMIKADQLDLEIKSGEAEVIKLEEKLNFSKSNAEYTALQNQIKGVKEKNSVAEDEALVILEKIEDVQRNAKLEEAKFVEAEKVYADYLQKAKEEEERINQEIAGIRAKRVEQEKACDPEALAQYQQLMQYFSAHGGIAMAPVVANVCKACGCKILPNDELKLLRCQELVQCKACSRIIYLPGKTKATG